MSPSVVDEYNMWIDELPRMAVSHASPRLKETYCPPLTISSANTVRSLKALRALVDLNGNGLRPEAHLIRQKLL